MKESNIPTAHLSKDHYMNPHNAPSNQPAPTPEDNRVCKECGCKHGCVCDYDVPTNQAPTPETLLDWQQKSDRDTNISDSDWDKLKSLFGNLERERDEAIKSIHTIDGKLMLAQRERDEARRDALNCRQIIDTYSRQEDDLIKAQAERDQLRKVADELAKVVEQRVIPTGPCMFRYHEEHKNALAAYNELKGKQ